jgi:translation elongation factor EF-1beta
MKFKPIKPEHKKVLERIQNSIPKEWLDNLTRKEPIAEPVKEIIERALVDDEVSEEVKEKFRLVKDSGYLDKEIEVENGEITLKIDKYIDEEIEKAIKRGELPKGKKNRNVGKKIKRIIKYKNGTSKEGNN